MARSYTDTLKDISEVMNRTSCSEDDAIAALLDTGSVIEAIDQVRAEQRQAAFERTGQVNAINFE